MGRVHLLLCGHEQEIAAILPTRLGADDAFVYHEVLGLSDDEIATAAAAGAFT